jgi:hypothetical protein
MGGFMTIVIDGSGTITGASTLATTVASPTLTTPIVTTTIGVGGATPSASGSGITFPATQSASTDANTLDDYEEGTWTPTVTSASYTLASSEGRYTKIGRMVCVTCRLNFSAVNGSSNSSCDISSLPFAGQGNQTAGVFRDNTTSGAVYMFQIENGNTLTARINSYSGINNGSARTIATGENYDGCAVYFI